MGRGNGRRGRRENWSGWKKVIIEIILKTFVFILINFEDIYVSDK